MDSACVSVCVCVYRTSAYVAGLALCVCVCVRGVMLAIRVSVYCEGVGVERTDVAEAKEEKKEGKKGRKECV